MFSVQVSKSGNSGHRGITHNNHTTTADTEYLRITNISNNNHNKRSLVPGKVEAKW